MIDVTKSGSAENLKTLAEAATFDAQWLHREITDDQKGSDSTIGLATFEPSVLNEVYNGETALTLAAKHNKFDLIPILMRKGASLGAVNKERLTAAWVAYLEGNHVFLEHLIDKGAKLTHKVKSCIIGEMEYENITLAQHAALSKNEGIEKLLKGKQIKLHNLQFEPIHGKPVKKAVQKSQSSSELLSKQSKVIIPTGTKPQTKDSSPPKKEQTASKKLDPSRLNLNFGQVASGTPSAEPSTTVSPSSKGRTQWIKETATSLAQEVFYGGISLGILEWSELLGHVVPLDLDDPLVMQASGYVMTAMSLYFATRCIWPAIYPSMAQVTSQSLAALGIAAGLQVSKIASPFLPLFALKQGMQIGVHQVIVPSASWLGSKIFSWGNTQPQEEAAELASDAPPPPPPQTK